MDEPTPNFLTSPIAPELQPPKRRYVRWIFLFAALAILSLLAPLVYGGAVAGLGAQQAKTALFHAQASMLTRDLEAARTDVEQAQTGLAQVHNGLEAASFWKSMPVIGIHIRAFQDAEQTGSTVSESVLALIDAALSVQQGLPSAFADLTREEKRTILARVHDALPEVRIAREKATIALEGWERIPRSELIAPVQRALEPADEPLRRLQRGLDEAVSLADALLPLMGYPKQKNYLVLPYSVDGSPDFPQTAERYLAATLGTEAGAISGVIALQPTLLSDVQRWIGPFQTDGKISGDKMSDALIKALMRQPISRLPALLDFATQSLTQKDMLIYDRDPSLLAVLDARHWSGRTLAAANDYLWVVDANLEKNIRYALDATDSSGPVATVTLSYKNANAAVDGQRAPYRDNVRLYVPEGSELMASSGVSGNAEVYKDLGKTVFAGLWAIEPNETREFRFTYRLPASAISTLRDGMYHLLVQKQPGTNTNLTLDHKFGKNVGSATPTEDPKNFGDTQYQVNLPMDRDQIVDVKLQP